MNPRGTPSTRPPHGRVELAKTVLLVGLVALSLFLSSRIWFSPAFSKPPRLVQTTYVTPGNERLSDWADLVHPRRVYFHLGDGRTVGADEVLESQVWRAIARVGALTARQDLNPMDPEELDRLRRGGSGTAGVEAVLSTQAPYGFWRQVWQAWPPPGQPQGVPGLELQIQGGEGVPGAPAGAGPDRDEADPNDVSVTGPPVDRVSLFIGGGELTFVAEYGGEAFGMTAGFRDPGHPLQPDLGQVAGGLETLLGEMAGWADHPTVERLGDVQGDLRLEPGLAAPMAPPTGRIFYVEAQPVDTDALVRSFFVDLAFLRTVPGRDVTLYSDGRSSLAWQPGGFLDYQNPAAMGPPYLRDPLDALQETLEFINGRGGWPGGAFLKRIQPIRERGSLVGGGREGIIGWRLEFGVRVDGLPLDEAPIVVVEVGSGGVAGLSRRFVRWLPTEFFRDPGPAARAVEVVARIPEEFLPADARRVIDMERVYLPLAVGLGEDWLFPTWGFRLHQGWRIWVEASPFQPRGWVESPDRPGDWEEVWPQLPIPIDEAEDPDAGGSGAEDADARAGDGAGDGGTGAKGGGG